VLSSFVVESAVFALAVLPAALFWEWHFRRAIAPPWLHVLVLAASFVPAYLLFAVMLMLLSAGSVRLLGWRTPADAELRIAEVEWPLLHWVRYLVSTHLVRVFAGALLRASPLWTLYLRWNGARVGRGVWVNSTSLMDHNLLELGDGVVIGSDVHLSGHTVERGVVKTARVRVGAGATIGVGSVIGIGVEIGAGTQVGALSVVPKHVRLEPGAVYAGVPVRRLDGGA
jgi:acetyltransferase-like isoleucine patch superfamily enzyme